MKRRWYHNWYVVELRPEHRVGGLLVASNRRVVCWTWTHRSAQKLARWYNDGRIPYDVNIGIRCVVEPA